jgi:hypothetical protein
MASRALCHDELLRDKVAIWITKKGQHFLISDSFSLLRYVICYFMLYILARFNFKRFQKFSGVIPTRQPCDV